MTAVAGRQAKERDEVARLLAAAAAAERDAEAEWPGSYYRKAHRARARRLRQEAAALAAQDTETGKNT